MPGRSFSRSLLAALALAVLGWSSVAPAGAQPPSAAWRTLVLPHFRVHYPAASEAWARRVAGRLEGIRARLGREVGYEPPQVVDVVIANPQGQPNGSAWPFLDRPRMVLWTTPPEPASLLGVYRDWGELVSVHEEAHLVHLLRPSRNPLQRLAGRLLPGFGLGPVERRAPRWATEGYATLLEGRLTGSGRPNSDLRAAVLRLRAVAGHLPSYGALSAGDESWLGPSMAYLAGSAFLQWLEERSGPESLPHLWARLSARRNRSFDDAFAGVFGDSPEVLWGRFRAQLTWRAVEAERRLGVPPSAKGAGAPASQGRGEAGTLWMDLSRRTGAPTVSPDGSRLAVVLRPRDEPPRLVVFGTGPNEEAERRYREEQAKMLERDPEDVAAVRSGPLPRAPAAVLPTIDGRAPFEPRWTPDGRSLLFTAFGPDPDGVYHPDLYLWTPGERRTQRSVRRLTRFGDLRSADPAPGPPADRGHDQGQDQGAGGWAVAVLDRDGLSQLVAVDLADGRVTPLTEASAGTTWASPRVAPDGHRLAALRHSGGRWRLVVANLDGSGPPTGISAVREVDTGAATTLADPAWGPRGRTIYASLGSEGFVDLWALDPAGGAPRRLTRVVGAALAPAPTPDRAPGGGALYFLAMEDDGFDLRHLKLGAAAPPEPSLPPDLAPAIRSGGEAAAPKLPAATLPAARPYGAGPQAIEPLVGLLAAPSGRALELGVHAGDPVGRFDGFLLGSLAGAGATDGATVAGAWRGFPVTLSAQAFAVSETPSEQADAPPAIRSGPSSPGGGALDRDRRGLALGARWERRSATGGLAVRLGLDGERVEPGAGGSLERRVASLGAGLLRAPSRGEWSLPLRLSADFDRGRTDGGSWSRWHAGVGLGVERGDDALRLTWSRGGSRDVRAAFDRFQVGGAVRSLLPVEAEGGVVPVPALPAAYLLGDEEEAQRVELDLSSLGLLPAPLVFERHRVWNEGETRGGWLELAGLEIHRDLPPLPIVGLPALRATAGAAYVLEDPVGDLKSKVRLWVAVAWRP